MLRGAAVEEKVVNDYLNLVLCLSSKIWPNDQINLSDL